jgi:hypothetical protein
MDALIAKLRKNSFRAHLVALTCMVTAAALLYLAAQQGSTFWIWILIGLFILGNLMELIIL